VDVQVNNNECNELRWDPNDKCWVREILVNGAWFCFYSAVKERLTDKEMGVIIKNRILGYGLPDIVNLNAKYFSVEQRGYMHVIWDDYYPQTGAFKDQYPVNWHLFVIIMLPNGPAPATPITPANATIA